MLLRRIMDGDYFLKYVSLNLAAAVLVSAEDQTINATVGQNVTLPCPAKDYLPFKVVEWSRPGPELKHVLVFQKPNPNLKVPEQSYKDRVELKDVKNGDVSLVLKNVTAEDGGTYECYVLKQRASSPKLIRTIYLDVAAAPPPLAPSLAPGNKNGSRDGGEKEGGGNQDGSAFGRGHIMAACAVMLVLAAMAVTAAISCKKWKNSISPPNVDAKTPESWPKKFIQIFT